MRAMLGGRKKNARCERKKFDTSAICCGLTSFVQRRIRSNTMPMMFPGRGMPTMRWRISPATQMAKMMVSWRKILIIGLAFVKNKVKIVKKFFAA
jgi:hypothetical protein